MKAELVNPFYIAIKEIFEQVTGIKMEKEKVFLKTSTIATKNVVVLIGTTGQLKGNTVINMDEAFAKKVASNMMGGAQISEFDEMAKSAVSELGNMILGRAATLLSNMGIRIDITPPTLLTGRNIELTFLGAPTIAVILKSSIGSIEVNISVRE